MYEKNVCEIVKGSLSALFEKRLSTNYYKLFMLSVATRHLTAHMVT